MTVITLTTDFGSGSHYSGQMKGVISSRAPRATVVDLCHTIRRHDIAQAAMIIESSRRFFPAATIHIVVIDPGVGGERQIILLTVDDHYFIAPDNGVLSRLPLAHPQAKCFIVQRPDLYIKPLSRTFHGRDIMAPAAAHLASGGRPADLGPEISPRRLITLPLPPAPEFKEGRLSGVILDIDFFGNITTNIKAADLAPLSGPLTARLNNHKITLMAESYEQAAPGGTLLIINSSDALEIAVNQGRAADLLEAEIGMPVIIEAGGGI
ncbi:SAM hydrolase/SAM-dependent halogenase family protein [Desulfobacterota bacterium M19]